MIEFIKFRDKPPCFNENWSGIQLIPLNYDAYVIPFRADITGIIMFYLVDCFGKETDITENCKIVGNTIEISKLTYDIDRRVFLKIIGEKEVCSNVFKVSSENKEYTTRIDYRCKTDNILYSIQLQIFEMYSKRAAELSSYYQMSTHKQVSFLPSNAKYFLFKSKVMFIETLNSVIDVFNNREVYFDYEQVNLFSAPDIDDPEPYTYILETNFEITKLGKNIKPKIYFITDQEGTELVCIFTCYQDFNQTVLGSNVKFTKGRIYRQHNTDISYFVYDDNSNVVTKEQLNAISSGVVVGTCSTNTGNKRIITDDYKQILID